MHKANILYNCHLSEEIKIKLINKFDSYLVNLKLWRVVKDYKSYHESLVLMMIMLNFHFILICLMLCKD